MRLRVAQFLLQLAIHVAGELQYLNVRNVQSGNDIAGDCRRGERAAYDGDVEGRGPALRRANDGQLDRCADFARDERAHLINGFARDILAVYPDDPVPRLEGALGGRRVGNDGVDANRLLVAAAQVHADAYRRRVAQLILLGLELLGGLEAAVPVVAEANHHTLDGGVGHLLVVDRIGHYIILLDIVPGLQHEPGIAAGDVGTVGIGVAEPAGAERDGDEHRRQHDLRDPPPSAGCNSWGTWIWRPAGGKALCLLVLFLLHAYSYAGSSLAISHKVISLGSVSVSNCAVRQN